MAAMVAGGSPQETTGTATVPRTVSPSTRIRSGLLVALAAGTAGTASGWALLWWEQLDLVHRIAQVTWFDAVPEVDQHHAYGFGSLVAGLALLAWLLASRRGAPARRSLALVGGTFVAWTVIAWFLLPATVSVGWWPGPVVPVTYPDSNALFSDPDVALVHSAAPAAFLGPLVVLIAIVAAAWVGSRVAASREITDVSGDPPVPSRMASRMASGLVGAGVLVGIGGVAALVFTRWSAILPEGTTVLTSLADRQVLLAAIATVVAWLVSGTARGTATLVLVATAAVVGEDLTSESLLQTGAALLTIVTASIATARRSLAAALDRLTL